MPRISDLLGVHGKIWFYVGEEEETQRQFMEEAIEMGCRFSNGKEPKVTGCGVCMAIHSDGTIAYVSLMIWDISFNPDKFQRINLDGADRTKELKVDYEAFTSGKECFVYGKLNLPGGSPAMDNRLITLAEGLSQLNGR